MSVWYLEAPTTDNFPHLAVSALHCTAVADSETQGWYLYNCHHSAFVIFTVKLHTTLPQCQNTRWQLLSKYKIHSLLSPESHFFTPVWDLTHKYVGNSDTRKLLKCQFPCLTCSWSLLFYCPNKFDCCGFFWGFFTVTRPLTQTSIVNACQCHCTFSALLFSSEKCNAVQYSVVLPCFLLNCTIKTPTGQCSHFGKIICRDGWDLWWVCNL